MAGARGGAGRAAGDPASQVSASGGDPVRPGGGHG